MAKCKSFDLLYHPESTVNVWVARICISETDEDEEDEDTESSDTEEYKHKRHNIVLP